MFGEEGKEMSIVRNILGDVPLVGFFGLNQHTTDLV